jgi:hypothetical protein
LSPNTPRGVGFPHAIFLSQLLSLRRKRHFLFGKRAFIRYSSIVVLKCLSPLPLRSEDDEDDDEDYYYRREV